MPLLDPCFADAFTDHLTRQGWSPATAHQSTDALARWEHWLSLHRRAVTIRTARHHDIVAYLDWLRADAASRGTVTLVLAALRAYHAWIRLADDPTASLEGPGQTTAALDTRQQAQRLLAAIFEPDHHGLSDSRPDA